MAPDTAAGRGQAVIPASDLLGPDTSLIYNDWYPAMRSDGLRGRKMATAMLLGIPLVLGRKEDGSIFAMRDSCPHRGIPLSCGWFDGSAVTCKYHGWVFEPESGQCMEIPSLTSQDSYPRRIYANAFPCRKEMDTPGSTCPSRAAGGSAWSQGMHCRRCRNCPGSANGIAART
jgi:nitrite reductase/ring-hydroxylating ferredoxin subunit